jgi:hypothetical protein
VEIGRHVPQTSVGELPNVPRQVSQPLSVWNQGDPQQQCRAQDNEAQKAEAIDEIPSPSHWPARLNPFRQHRPHGKRQQADLGSAARNAHAHGRQREFSSVVVHDASERTRALAACATPVSSFPVVGVHDEQGR